MLGGTEFRLREVGGFAANFNRANRRGTPLKAAQAVGRSIGILRLAESRDVGALRRGLMRPASPPTSTARTGAECEGTNQFLIRHFTALARNIRFANIARH